MSSQEISNLADKIARLIQTESAVQPELGSLHAAIEKINQRLDKLESDLAGSAAQAPVPTPVHPSHARFNIAEAIADAVFDSKTKEKACTFEPNARPCDSCGMCSSRGF